jgi:DNA polymerase II large subunit
VKLSSSQNNDTASALRIRENQRRSRNRRKELIEELQGRLNEYERKGVEATQDMQRAARKVAQENMRLRSLLARHGVSQEEVEIYLRLSEMRLTMPSSSPLGITMD